MTINVGVKTFFSIRRDPAKPVVYGEILDGFKIDKHLEQFYRELGGIINDADTEKSLIEVVDATHLTAKDLYDLMAGFNIALRMNLPGNPRDKRLRAIIVRHAPGSQFFSIVKQFYNRTKDLPTFGGEGALDLVFVSSEEEENAAIEKVLA